MIAIARMLSAPRYMFGICLLEALHTRDKVFDLMCFYYFVRNSLVALLEALCARIFSFRSVYVGFCF